MVEWRPIVFWYDEHAACYSQNEVERKIEKKIVRILAVLKW